MIAAGLVFLSALGVRAQQHSQIMAAPGRHDVYRHAGIEQRGRRFLTHLWQVRLVRSRIHRRIS
jgi:hypothetical protein